MQLRAQYTLYARAISEMNVIERYVELHCLCFAVSTPVHATMRVSLADSPPSRPFRLSRLSLRVRRSRSFARSIMV